MGDCQRLEEFCVLPLLKSHLSSCCLSLKPRGKGRVERRGFPAEQPCLEAQNTVNAEEVKNRAWLCESPHAW